MFKHIWKRSEYRFLQKRKLCPGRHTVMTADGGTHTTASWRGKQGRHRPLCFLAEETEVQGDTKVLQRLPAQGPENPAQASVLFYLAHMVFWVWFGLCFLLAPNI